MNQAHYISSHFCQGIPLTQGYGGVCKPPTTCFVPAWNIGDVKDLEEDDNLIIMREGQPLSKLSRKENDVEPQIKDTPNKGHNRNILRTKDKFQCTKWRLFYSSDTFLTSDKGQPLKMARKQWVPNVSVIRSTVLSKEDSLSRKMSKIIIPSLAF